MVAEINFLNIEENDTYGNLIYEVLTEAFHEEKLDKLNVYLNIILTNPTTIQETNKKYRGVDRATDVLSFPMFEREEVQRMVAEGQPFPGAEALGDIMISIPKVEEQAQEYGHSFERELAYMLIHGFYHIMGYDHMEAEEKKEMRAKEEKVLNKLQIVRE